MNKDQLQQVLDYLDCEYAGIINRMTETEKKSRAKHWASEVGSLDFNTVMTAVRKLARGPYMPRTGEVLSEVEKAEMDNAFHKPNRDRYWWKPKCKIWKGQNGEEYYDYRNADGTETLNGIFRNLPEWMQLKFRWLADPTPENSEAWENFILANEERDEYANEGRYELVDALMAMV